MKNTKVMILGTRYKIEKRKILEDPILYSNDFVGYCCEETPLIVIADMSDAEGLTYEEKRKLENTTLRHEIIHAFLNECGLMDSSFECKSWAKNEEMVDWFAIQSPKIFNVYKELDIL